MNEFIVTIASLIHFVLTEEEKMTSPNKLSVMVYDSAYDNDSNQTNTRIIHGEEASRNQFPWYVTVNSWSSYSASSSFCGGSIISSLWILTAGHCVEGGVTFTMGLGSKLMNMPMIKMYAKSFMAHPEYDTTTLQHDIALIELPVPLEFSEKIYPVDMPDSSEAYVDETAHVCGHGRYDPHTEDMADKLMWIEKRIISNQECSQTFGPLIYDSTICGVGLHDIDAKTCNGDSGGPLVIPDDDGGAVQIGIVSFSSKGCDHGDPDGYVRVSSYLDWISEYTDVYEGGTNDYDYDSDYDYEYSD